MLDLVEYVVPPSPADQAGTCRICRDFSGLAPLCRTCDDYRTMGFAPPVPVEPISLYDRTSHLRPSLTGYKNPDESHRRSYAAALRRLIDSFLVHHLFRLHHIYGTVDAAVVVPSTQGLTHHPLHRVLAAGSIFGGGAALLEPFAPTSMLIPRRHLNPAAFTPDGSVDVDGRRLWLIDDVYASGATAQSAAAALHAAGAQVACIIVVGRRLNPHVHPGIARLYAAQQASPPQHWIESPVATAA